MAIGEQISGPLWEGLFDTDIGSRGIWDLALRNAFGSQGAFSSQGRQVAPLFNSIYGQYLGEKMSRSPRVGESLSAGLNTQTEEPRSFLDYVGGLDVPGLYRNLPLNQRTGFSGGRFQPIPRRIR